MRGGAARLSSRVRRLIAAVTQSHVTLQLIGRLVIGRLSTEDSAGIGVPVAPHPIQGAVHFLRYQFQGDEARPGPPGIAPRRHLRQGHQLHGVHRRLGCSAVTTRGVPLPPGGHLRPGIKWSRSVRQGGRKGGHST
ncbi:hypothetical protein E2C01_012126 [Portunus trituberculatus]|uniref:Uncharacterized protein n=1 Tax=Portunus trituberculatus TaxID=210409 RepID=A0A5B7DDS5_PORTR|nr:hypothetical protein [Portunus trituberculatus]